MAERRKGDNRWQHQLLSTQDIERDKAALRGEIDSFRSVDTCIASLSVTEEAAIASRDFPGLLHADMMRPLTGQK